MESNFNYKNRDGYSLMSQCKSLLQARLNADFFNNTLIFDENTAKTEIMKIVENVDKQIIMEKKCDVVTSGCTFTIVIYFKEIFYIANVGGAHCIYATYNEPKTESSARRPSVSRIESERRSIPMSNFIVRNENTTVRATRNPMKAAGFLYNSARESMIPLYGDDLLEFNLKTILGTHIDMLTSDHSMTNYDEVLKFTELGCDICKDKKKDDLPFYARPFKLYLNPNYSYPGLARGSDWPALKYTR